MPAPKSRHADRSLDSSWSISQGGGFNVWMINLPIFAVTLAVIGWSASTIPSA